jgi:hypothetical protein
VSQAWICWNGQWQDRATGLPAETAPVQLVPRIDARVPVEIAQEAYKEYAAQHGTSQSFERLCERGGFSATELAILLYERIKRLECTQSPPAQEKL